jgi:hypothetical protein
MSTEIDLATELAAVKAQLKEQTQQMAEMASMMKSMMSLAMPLLEEQTRKVRSEKEETRKRWKEEHKYYWSECMASIKLRAMRKAEENAAQNVLNHQSSPDWSCPDDGCAHNWVHAGKQYVRTFEGGVWEYDGECVGEWVGQWDPRTKTIDMTVFEPEFDE